jgi:hypothetical protein
VKCQKSWFQSLLSNWVGLCCYVAEQTTLAKGESERASAAAAAVGAAEERRGAAAEKRASAEQEHRGGAAVQVQSSCDPS